ncbi:TPA: hypothetical protein RU316_001815 [Legionella pneumophila]|nr:hypothetical protein [Legionella pneumophila]MDI9844513.1 hypothetical protein [Legionella pneumophila]HBD9289618.1 hypothetical protein [Legionella pneumophila]HDU8069846.1 hypothetical protein [Legionella pneumophila]HDZ9664382.1 hypothetical protein [Legionella pneumophila]HEL8471711.1 hypothetical protein [Legionella pneumophila]
MTIEKDKQILDAIVKSNSIDFIGRGTLTLDPKDVINSDKYKDLIEKTSKVINIKNEKAKK